MQENKSLWKRSPAFRAGVAITLCVLFIMGLTAITHLFTTYDVSLTSTPAGLRMELVPRVSADDVLQSPNRPPIFRPDDENGPDNLPPMPIPVLGDGTTMEIHPIPTYDEETGASPRLSFQEIFQRNSPSVVLIEVTLRFGARGSGTGVIMTENGYIITSAHVVEGARQVTVTLEDGTPFPAAILGMDEGTDTAVLKIDAQGLTPAEFGDSDQLQVGEEVAVIGNPLGHLHSMTSGIISALDRDVVYDGVTMRLIQTNAAINQGNSGGPLINLYGQVVGITNMKLVGHFTSVEGMGFAVPTASIRPVVDSIIAHGRVVGRPALGIVVRTVDAHDAAQEGIAPGLYIERVLEGTDAHAQGLQADDRILTANGAPVAVSVDLLNQIQGFRAGETIRLTIERDGQELTLQIRLMDAALLEF